jgi:hypothetical protein
MSGRSAEQRLGRLEGIAAERLMYEKARRLAEESGTDIEDTAIELVETYQRIERYGLDAEVCRMAREFGKSEDEVRAEIDAEIAAIKREDSQRP